jgi:hypothetical protein
MVRAVYSNPLGYRPLGKRANASAVNFEIQVSRIRTRSDRSQAKIDGSGFCSGDMADICVELLGPS